MFNKIHAYELIMLFAHGFEADEDSLFYDIYSVDRTHIYQSQYSTCHFTSVADLHKNK